MRKKKIKKISLFEEFYVKTLCKKKIKSSERNYIFNVI